MQKLGNMSRLKRLGTAAAFAVLAAGAGMPAVAQNLFAPAVLVNDDVVTGYEIEQRLQFLTLLNAPGATRDAVIETLIDERLRKQAVDAAGLEITPEGLAAGMSEFAARANLEGEEMVSRLEEAGVARESFEDFISIGVTWRDLIAARFGRRLEISEDEIDRALGSTTDSGGIRVLVSEIIIPAPPEQREEVNAVADQIAASASAEEFSEYARRYSATATRDQGGRLPWQQLSNLPPVLRPLLLALAPGEVTAPIAIPDAVALFQLRDIEETGDPVEEYAAIEYATYYLPGGRSQAGLNAASKLRARVDICDDLYGVAKGKPEEILERQSLPPGEIPQDIAIELSKLDPGEVSTALTRSGGETLVFLMLCGRTSVINEEVAREDAAAALRERTINTYAQSLLAQLRADARIVFP